LTDFLDQPDVTTGWSARLGKSFIDLVGQLTIIIIIIITTTIFIVLSSWPGHCESSLQLDQLQGLCGCSMWTQFLET